MLNFILLIVAAALIILTILFIKNKSGRESVCGKFALVTGGSNGLGQQICIELARNGCNVIIADISPANETLEMLKQFSVISKAYKVDVSNFEEISMLKKNILDEFGTVDILINNAGLMAYKPLLKQTSQEIERLLKVNVNSVVLMTKCFLEKMIKDRRGHIVSISSLQGIYAFPHSLCYSASKFAVTGFMLALKEHLRQQNYTNIATTCVFPNTIATRDDIVNAVDAEKFEILTPKSCAKSIVEGIVSKKSYLTLPSYYSVIIPYFNFMPFWIQHLVRDFRQEHLFLKFN